MINFEKVKSPWIGRFFDDKTYIKFSKDSRLENAAQNGLDVEKIKQIQKPWEKFAGYLTDELLTDVVTGTDRSLGLGPLRQACIDETKSSGKLAYIAFTILALASIRSVTVEESILDSLEQQLLTTENKEWYHTRAKIKLEYYHFTNGVFNFNKQLYAELTIPCIAFLRFMEFYTAYKQENKK